ncbi:UNVERIFIED_CONTAM: hypothetical protein Slati_0448000 [Sesamum latifolium]|uniref:Uncharacterized protein n=1 Tax=Sesamum latifolium TaxID=2727402 RepID=A0AAW2XW35_9LAMI
MASFDDRLNKLPSLVVEKPQQIKACGTCTLLGHATDMYPTLQEPPTEHADAIGGFLEQQQRRYYLSPTPTTPDGRITRI